MVSGDSKRRINKVFKKLDALARAGTGSELSYYSYVDEMLANSMYPDLVLCLEVKYGLDPLSYPSLGEMKRETWGAMLEMTKDILSWRLKKLYDSKDVYQIGTSFYSGSWEASSVDLSQALSFSYSELGSESLISAQALAGKVVITSATSGVYGIGIERGEWPEGGVPARMEKLDYWLGGTGSVPYSLESSVPLTVGGEYRITVEKRDPYSKQYHRMSVKREDFLGTISEVSVDEYVSSGHYYRNRELMEILGYSRTILEVRKSSGEVATMLGVDPSLSEEMNLYKRYVLALDFLLS